MFIQKTAQRKKLTDPLTATTSQTEQDCFRCSKPCAEYSGAPDNPESATYPPLVSQHIPARRSTYRSPQQRNHPTPCTSSKRIQLQLHLKNLGHLHRLNPQIGHRLPLRLMPKRLHQQRNRRPPLILPKPPSLPQRMTSVIPIQTDILTPTLYLTGHLRHPQTIAPATKEQKLLRLIRSRSQQPLNCLHPLPVERHLPIRLRLRLPQIQHIPRLQIPHLAHANRKQLIRPKRRINPQHKQTKIAGIPSQIILNRLNILLQPDRLHLNTRPRRWTVRIFPFLKAHTIPLNHHSTQ